ncbi:MAG TPA: MarR family transcriptional regulator [Candidatus Peribacteraceae bacterium]|nr:MarR family transcriptional regulator [Candidatus Peribacteraceae bacterium]
MNPKQDAPDRIITLWMQITRLLHQRMVHLRKGKGPSALNPMQIHALIIIKEHDGLTMKEFAQFLHVTSPSATSFANRLVRLKWIKRIADKKNRKLVRLRLTDAGTKVITTKMKEHTKVMRELFELLSGSDQEEFVRILANLHTALAKHTK